MKKLNQIISWITSKFKWLSRNLDTWKFYGLLMSIGGLITWFTYSFSTELRRDTMYFSDFGLILLFIAICVGTYHAFDVFILKDIDTINEIKGHGENSQGNISLGLLLVALAIVILAGAITVS